MECIYCKGVLISQKTPLGQRIVECYSCKSYTCDSTEEEAIKKWKDGKVIQGINIVNTRDPIMINSNGVDKERKIESDDKLLTKCDKCGMCADFDYIETRFKHREYYIFCTGCGVKTKSYFNPQSAFDSWNMKFNKK